MENILCTICTFHHILWALWTATLLEEKKELLKMFQLCLFRNIFVAPLLVIHFMSILTNAKLSANNALSLLTCLVHGVEYIKFGLNIG